ncbi:MAG: Holliday junction resolvase RuvX [Bacteriovoracaceae bacterium]|nr:Holliday junction resolvase RuvX [Bacteroidota bacterium]
MTNNLYTRYMGLDYGTVRIGVSVSDPLKIIAQGFTTLANNADCLDRITAIIEEQAVEKIIVGNPLNLRGEVSTKAEEVGEFVKRLKTKTSVEIIMLDERFTSVMAQRSIITMGAKKKQRQNNKGKVDEVAAAILLQSYLDTQSHAR